MNGSAFRPLIARPGLSRLSFHLLNKHRNYPEETHVSLHVLGWNDFFERHWNSLERRGLAPGRVVEEQKDACRVVTESGETAAEVTGRLRHQALQRSGCPAVGDWVALAPLPAQNKALIHEVLPRRTKLSRRAAGPFDEEQI